MRLSGEPRRPIIVHLIIDKAFEATIEIDPLRLGQQIRIGQRQFPPGVQGRREAESIDVPVPAMDRRTVRVEIAVGVLVRDRVEHAQGIPQKGRVVPQWAARSRDGPRGIETAVAQ